ncbi:Syntaxin-like protein 6 [Elsinoe fawcettii]|nr:Syntaxin-like protein 6 [Elsinoe fawcettii]
MSYNQYQGYGGNPYGDSNNSGGGYGANPYGDAEQGYGQQNPYGGRQQNTYGGPEYDSQLAQQTNDTDNGHVLQPNGIQPPSQGPTTLSQSDFLSRVEAAKADIRTLTSQISSIASAHQRVLSSPDSSASASLESLITQTQVLNTSIKDQIKFLETDNARSAQQNGGVKNSMKASQVESLKGSFRRQLQDFTKEEADYEGRYREQIARQYRIVNPDASEAEVREAQNANWGDEGVFQTALKTNRTATASTVLGAVRARHADIQRIEKTMQELAQLMELLAQEVVVQEPAVMEAERHAEAVKTDVEGGNVQLGKAEESARRARKLKWWCFWIVVIIVLVLALVLGLVFGLQNRARQTATGGARRRLM